MYYIMFRKRSDEAWSFSEKTFPRDEAISLVRRYRRTGYHADYVVAMS